MFTFLCVYIKLILQVLQVLTEYEYVLVYWILHC